MKEYKIAIMGASGYIGAYLTRFLENKGHEVYAMGRKSAQKNTDKFIPFELGQSLDVTNLTGIEVLIHCAYDFSLTDYAAIRKINLEGSRELFEQAKKAGVKKIIYFSTTSAFETAQSFYGQIKFETEALARKYDAMIVRPGLVFSKNPGGIVGSINKIVQKSKLIPIIGSGNQEFYPCHLEDLSELIAFLLNISRHYELPIVAASEKAITFKELIQRMAAQFQKKPITVPVPYHFLFLGLKLAELFKLKLNLRSDSLKYLKHYNRHLDFKFIRDNKLHFRSFG